MKTISRLIKRIRIKRGWYTRIKLDGYEYWRI